QWKSRAQTITRSGDDRRLLLRLPRPITAVASLTIDGVAIAAIDYFIHADAGKIELRTRSFSVGIGNVVVTLTAGYTVVPGHIVAAALDLAKAHYDEWQNGAVSLSQITVGPATAIIRPG